MISYNTNNQSYIIKILDSKSYISMDEYYVIQFYQLKPTIKYYLVKNIVCNMYIILDVMYFIYLINICCII
jgi:hypothetical protein